MSIQNVMTEPKAVLNSDFTAVPKVVQEEFLSHQIMNFDCHSSSFIETSPGQYCAVWKGGPGVGQSNKTIDRNVGVWMTVYDGVWSTPVEIVSAPDSICWNPILCQLPSKELLLFYRVGSDPRSCLSFIKRSNDDGRHWSKEEMLPAGIIGPTKNKPIVTSNGTIICPSSREVGNPLADHKATSCWIEISEDGGRKWQGIGPLALPDRPFGVIEPALFYDREGCLRMLCRDRANRIGGIGYLWMSISRDGGHHWSELQKTELPNPDSGIDVVDFGKGKIALIYNHSHTDRYPLNLAISEDGGDHWLDPIVIAETGEFPSAVLAKDGLVHITYAAKADGEQRRIKHMVVQVPN